MILSVPITACIKICLQSLNHPIPRFLAGVFEGRIDNPVHEPDDNVSVFHQQKGALARGGDMVELAVLESCEAPSPRAERDVEAGAGVQDCLLPISIEAPRSGGGGSSMRS